MSTIEKWIIILAGGVGSRLWLLTIVSSKQLLPIYDKPTQAGWDRQGVSDRRKFYRGQGCGLILGDNVFYGAGLSEIVQRAAVNDNGATVFCHWVKDPSRYGVLEFDAKNRPISIEEKPKSRNRIGR